jgi:dTDP-4-amino-4,6-dideoxygalactose transaminase
MARQLLVIPHGFLLMANSDTSQHVPFLDLSQQFRQLQPEIDEALRAIFEKTSFVLGPHVEQFEEAFARYCGTRFCVSVSNGTIALQAALQALGIGAGDEVITAANTFVATAEAISYCGAVPRFVDVVEATANINTRGIEAAINERTKAIIPVHLYGQPCALSEIKAIADKHKLLVIEDACQAHGATYRGKKVGGGGWSQAACFSFYPGKNLGAAGDGGAIVTDDPALARQLRLLRNHGSEQKYLHEILGHNFRLDAIQAAVLNIKLPHLDEWNAARRRHAEYYRQQLQGLDNIRPIEEAADCTSVYHLFVVAVKDRTVVERVLAENNIGYGIHYPQPIHLQPAYLNSTEECKAGSFPIAERLAGSIVSLPMFPELKREQQDRVIKALAIASEQMRQAVEV